MKVTKFDAAQHLDSEEKRDAYLDEARRSGDAKYLRHAEQIVERSRTMKR